MPAKKGGEGLEVLQPVFRWLSSLNIMQDGYIAKKKSGSVILTSQATNAIMTGHVFYFILYNVLYSKGQPMTVQLTGSPGDALPSQSVLYNWNVLSDVFGSLGVALSADHRQLLANGDRAMLIELLYEMYNSYSGEAAVGTTNEKGSKAKKSAEKLDKAQQQLLARRSSSKRMLKPNRDGALSVDEGRERMKVEAILASAKAKYNAKCAKQEEEERKKQHHEEEARLLRVRMTSQLGLDADRYRPDLSASQSLPQVYREFGNRAAVQFCHNMLLDIVDAVESGEAQERLEEKARTKEKFRQQTLNRKKGGQRLVDVGCSVHVPRKANHALFLSMKSIVVDHIVGLALQDDVQQQLAKREAARKRETQLLTDLYSHARQKAQPVRRVKKYAERVKEMEEEDRRKKEVHERKMERMREENRAYGAALAEEARAKQEENMLAQQLEDEKTHRREALEALYQAEQRAKAKEIARQREEKKAEEVKRKEEEENQAAADRRQRGQALNAKLREKQQASILGLSKMTNPSLSPISLGSGEHAAYFGETLGWQFLTETEFDLAQVFCQVRADPTCAAAWVDQRLGGIKGRTLWLTDDEGRRQPMTLCEGAEAHEEALSYLQKLKPQPPPGDVSIGLTLAARQHAIDLAHHGFADAHRHAGSDGSTLTQRVLKYGTPALRPGHSEIIFAVVRPSTFRYNPADVLASMIVDDGCVTRENRAALFHPVTIESIGVGHAIAHLGGKYCVETVVILTGYSFLDKPVAWMSQSHHVGVGSVAPPFLDGNRLVHSSLQTKRDLYNTSNVCIGRTVSQQPNFERLATEKLRKRQHQQPVLHLPPADSPVDNSFSSSRSPAPGQTRKSTQQRKLERVAYRERLVRFYSKYAVHKLSIVESALTMYEGKEEEMFFTLIRKYGPEPHPEEDVSVPYNWEEIVAAGSAAATASPTRKDSSKTSSSSKRTPASTKSSKRSVQRNRSQQSRDREQRETKQQQPEVQPDEEPEVQKESSSAAFPEETADAQEASPQESEQKETDVAPHSPTEGEFAPAAEEEEEQTVPADESPAPDSEPAPNETDVEGSEEGIAAAEESESPEVENSPRTEGNELEAEPREEGNPPPSDVEAQDDQPAPGSGGAEAEAEVTSEASGTKPEVDTTPTPPTSEVGEQEPAGEQETTSPEIPPEETNDSLVGEERAAEAEETASNSGLASSQSASGLSSAIKSPSMSKKGSVSFKEHGTTGEQPEDTSSCTDPINESFSLGDRDVSEDTRDNNENAESDAERVARYRIRLQRLYAAFCPAKMGQVDKMLKSYEGKEDSMLRALVKKYGPEPPEEEEGQTVEHEGETAAEEGEKDIVENSGSAAE